MASKIHRQLRRGETSTVSDLFSCQAGLGRGLGEPKAGEKTVGLGPGARLEIDGNCVVFCSETFNHLASTFRATWPIGTDWGPDLAGRSAVIGHPAVDNAKNGV